ncbi:MAG: hypothetical protein NUV75_01210, partial [Gallionella sp.]|nr:hypothetical protein [Gallionella sp.]
MNDSNRKNAENSRLSAGNVASTRSGTGTMRDRLAKARVQYALEWGEGNAGHFTAAGYYDWMAAFLPKRRNVLEIGTGSGNGTLSLLSTGHTVVSVDENPE